MILMTGVGRAHDNDRSGRGRVADRLLDDAAAVALRLHACVADAGINSIGGCVSRFGGRVVAAADEQAKERNERESDDGFHASIVRPAVASGQEKST